MAIAAVSDCDSRSTIIPFRRASTLSSFARSLAHTGRQGLGPIAMKSQASIDGPKDTLDEIIEILAGEGAPLHITVIAERLSAIKGRQIPRTAIEPGLNRHVSKVKKLRIDKFAPSTYGLAEWKHQHETKLAS